MAGVPNGLGKTPHRICHTLPHLVLPHLRYGKSRIKAAFASKRLNFNADLSPFLRCNTGFRVVLARLSLQFVPLFR